MESGEALPDREAARGDRPLRRLPGDARAACPGRALALIPRGPHVPHQTRDKPRHPWPFRTACRNGHPRRRPCALRDLRDRDGRGGRPRGAGGRLDRDADLVAGAYVGDRHRRCCRSWAGTRSRSRARAHHPHLVGVAGRRRAERPRGQARAVPRTPRPRRPRWRTAPFAHRTTSSAAMRARRRRPPRPAWPARRPAATSTSSFSGPPAPPGAGGDARGTSSTRARRCAGGSTGGAASASSASVSVVAA